MIQITATLVLHGEPRTYRPSEGAERKCLNFRGWSKRRVKIGNEWTSIFDWLDCSWWVAANSAAGKLLQPGQTVTLTGRPIAEVYNSEKLGKAVASLKVDVTQLWPVGTRGGGGATEEGNEEGTTESSEETEGKDLPF